jgi:hypothetical protein
LDGQRIETKRDLPRQLGEALRFPTPTSGDYDNLTWDSASDWLSDLGWLAEQDESARGVLLLYETPMRLFNVDTHSFAMFADLVGDASTSLRARGLPLHAVLGPLERRAETLLGILRIHSLLCHDDHPALLLRDVRERAERAWSLRDYRGAVEAYEALSAHASAAELKRLEIARKRSHQTT